MTDAAPVQPASVDLVLHGASTVYLGSGRDVPGGWIAISAGRVASYGGPLDHRPEATRSIDVHGRLITPGLINTHHHIFQNLTRSFAPAVNGSLFQWLDTMLPIWARVDDESIYWSTYVGIAELLLGGCTTSSDHQYMHPHPNLIDAEIRAARDIGFRFYPTRGGMTKSKRDGFLPPDSVVESSIAILEDSERLVREYHDPNPGALIRVGLGPGSPFTDGLDHLTATTALAESLDVRIHTHLAQDADEDRFVYEMFGKSPIELFEDVGFAQPRTWVAHMVLPREGEAERLGRAKVGVAHCPSSNMLILSGTADVQRYRALGIPVGLGCDGSSSTDHASLWMETRNALLLSRYLGGPQAMTARVALDIATRGSAQCLGWDDEIGHLDPGALADIVVWDMSPFSSAGAWTDPIETLLRCGPARAWLTAVGGRILVEDGQLALPGADEALRAHERISREFQGLARAA